MSTVYVLGSLNEDLVVTCDRHPTPGETVLGHALQRSSGGKGANQAVAAARMGARVEMVGAVGSDDAGRRQRINLEVNGVGTACVRVRDGVDTAVALVVVDARAVNAIVVIPGANSQLTADDAVAPLTALGPDDVVLAQLEIPLSAVASGLAAAKDAGARTVLNAAPMTDVSALLDHVDLLLANEGEAAMLADQLDIPRDAPLAELAARAGCTVVVTLGGAGAAIATPSGDVVTVPGEHVDVVDTTGAGDTFVGALVARLAYGDSLEDAVRWANRAGALACTGLGAQTAMPYLHDLHPGSGRERHAAVDVAVPEAAER